MLTITQTTHDSRKVEFHPDETITVSTGECRIRSTVDRSYHLEVRRVGSDGLAYWEERCSGFLESDEECYDLDELHNALDRFELTGGI
jgi:hypothetical protein